MVAGHMAANMKKPVLEVAAVHDLSGYGRCSLTVAIPVLSAMGIQVCPLPTSILSTHTSGFKNYSFLDLTSQMQKIINHWKSLDIKFDAVYTGFLGSSAQINIIIDFIADFKHENLLVVVDPVMGDDGVLYDTIDSGIVSGMKKLICSADIITPNITEAAILVDEKLPEKEKIDKKYLKDLLKNLSDRGPGMVVVTSVPAGRENSSAVAAYDKKSSKYFIVKGEYIPYFYPGTGDIFTSVLTGALLNGESLPVASGMAAQFVSAAIKESIGYNLPARNGVMFEKVLNMLINPKASLYFTYREI